MLQNDKYGNVHASITNTPSFKKVLAKPRASEVSVYVLGRVMWKQESEFHLGFAKVGSTWRGNFVHRTVWCSLVRDMSKQRYVSSLFLCSEHDEIYNTSTSTTNDCRTKITSKPYTQISSTFYFSVHCYRRRKNTKLLVQRRTWWCMSAREKRW